MALAAPTFEVRRRRALSRADVLAIIGPIGSGKSATARVLSQEFGFRYVNSGEVLSKLLGIPPIPTTDRVTFQEAATNYVSTHRGVVQFAAALLEAAGDGPAVIEGIRNESTLIEIARRINIATIYVETPADVAYKFFTRREGSSGSVEQFLRARESPGESEVEGLKESCDAVIHNWSGHQSHRQVVRSLMKELGRRRAG
jgi:cytidylate kinase